LKCSSVKDRGIIVDFCSIISCGVLKAELIIQKNGKKNTININDKETGKNIFFLIIMIFPHYLNKYD